MRSFKTIALFATLAAAGCGDDPAQSVSGVFPASGYIGRTVRVEISGDNATWKEGVTIDMGTGITVGPITVASPTSLLADITIADTAALGPRDVVVRNGGSALTLKQSFELESPIAVTYQGALAQGSVVSFTVKNKDLANLFDDTCGFSFFGSCFLYSNFEATTPAGVNATISSVTPFGATGTLYVDTDAMSGPVKFNSGSPDDAANLVTSATGTDTTFMPRTAVALASGTPTTTTVMAAFDSHLYEFTAAATAVARFSSTPADPDADPTIYLLPDSGHFADMIKSGAAPNALSVSGSKYYAIWADASGLSGFSYVMRANNLALGTTVVEADTAGANDTAATAQATSGTTVFFNTATLSSDTDEDWIRVNVAAGNATKKVHVLTAGGDPQTDTYVEIYAADGTTLIGEGPDSGYHEDALSDPIGVAGATSIYVKIYGSPGYFMQAHNAYVAAIWLE